MKPLFVPLKAEYFDAFRAGKKDTEYRAYGPRWNERTCNPGRPVVLSRGYGKQSRIRGTVAAFDAVPVSALPKAARGAFEWCYNRETFKGKVAAIRLSIEKETL